MSKLAYGGGIGSAECRGGLPAVDVLHRERFGPVAGTARLFSSMVNSLAGPVFEAPVLGGCWAPEASCLGVKEVIAGGQSPRDTIV